MATRLAFAAGKLVGPVLQAMAEPELGQQFRGPFAQFGLFGPEGKP